MMSNGLGGAAAGSIRGKNLDVLDCRGICGCKRGLQ